MSPVKDSNLNHTESGIDDYTARMDRMLDSLKQKSKEVKSDKFKKRLIWFSIGTLLVTLLLFLMRIMNSRGFGGLSILFME